MKGLICKNFNQTLIHTGGGGVTHMSSKKPFLSLVCILALTCASQASNQVTAKWERNDAIKQEASFNPANGALNLNRFPNNPYKTVEFIFGSNVSGTLGVNLYDGMNMGDMTITSKKTSGDATTNLSLNNASMKTLTVGEKNTINITIQNASDKIETIDNKGTMTINNKGQTITTLTNTGGTIDNKSGSITTLTSNQGGNITNAGTITSLTYKAAPTTKAIQTKASTDSITNTGTITTFTNNGGHITNNGNITNLTNSNGNVNNQSGTITTFNNTGGNVNNSANIQTYTQESGNTMQSGGTIQTLTQKGGNFTYQGGTIGSLKQEGGSFNNLQNISLFTTQGGSLNNYQGTIENLKITSGDFELNNMQQGRIANIEIGGNGKININDNMN
ncbi:hypothetical protein, partial [Campylobacter upsaliensis]|uniref:hypothetical protein n=1 Tax=Campylobacter upsaliensis TaxID=28080 RepID=UPI0022EA9BCA